MGHAKDAATLGAVPAALEGRQRGHPQLFEEATAENVWAYRVARRIA